MNYKYIFYFETALLPAGIKGGRNFKNQRVTYHSPPLSPPRWEGGKSKNLIVEYKFYFHIMSITYVNLFEKFSQPLLTI